MISLTEGRSYMYQWDLNQRVKTDYSENTEVHFARSPMRKDGLDNALITLTDSEGYADIPNVFLQKSGDVHVYVYLKDDDEGGRTSEEFIFNILARKKPDDYVYTPTEVKNYDDLDARLTYLEENGGSGDLNIPTKISDLEDDTSIGAGTAIQWANNATTAESAIYDGDWNHISTTYTKKPTIIYWNESTLPFEFANRHNNVIRAGELTSISFTFGNGVYTEDYIADISFDSGETPTALDYTDSGILNWVGVDCVVNDGLSIFQPSANTHYDIIFYFNGTQFIGMVNGFVPSTGNVVS